MSNNIIAFGAREGCQHFTCAECHVEVYRYGDRSDVPICAECKFIGEHPHLPDDVKRLLRGERDAPGKESAAS